MNPKNEEGIVHRF